MRLVGQIPHPHFKISVHNYNAKYIIEVEAGPCKQIYKISETEVSGMNDIERLVDAEFIESNAKRFMEMRDDFAKTFKKNIT